MENQAIKTLQNVIKLYAKAFSLEWVSDISEFDIDLAGKTHGGIMIPQVQKYPVVYIITNSSSAEIWLTRDLIDLQVNQMQTEMVQPEILLEAVKSKTPIHNRGLS